MEKIILGIDPGTNIMGFGVIANKNNKIELINLDIIKLSHLKNQPLKLKSIFETSLSLIEKYKPDELAIEAQFYGKNIQSMLKLGRAQGVAIAAALYRDIPIFEYSPRKIKQAITGKGNASKEQVAAMLENIFKQNSNFINSKLSVINHAEGAEHKAQIFDASDALAVAVCHYFETKNFQDSPTSTTGAGKYTGWKAFISQNPERIK